MTELWGWKKQGPDYRVPQLRFCSDMAFSAVLCREVSCQMRYQWPLNQRPEIVSCVIIIIITSYQDILQCLTAQFSVRLLREKLQFMIISMVYLKVICEEFCDVFEGRVTLFIESCTATE